jgi:ubiquitin carboxyl-terminal hydrolase 14
MSDTVALSVKWGKETITLDFVVAGGVKGLKIELEEKTRVPADRMKCMAKSKGEIMKPSSLHCYIYMQYQ